MTVSFEHVDDTLLPRRYQEEIFSRARESNVIAALDTGSGKTFISTLLVKWISVRDAGLGKIIVFLVPKVALVEQQGDFIARQTPLRISKSCGATAVDLSDRHGWRKELLGADVFVMTAQIFLNILTHSLWSLEKVSLIVFDECHHTRKNHAYNGIMREYFQTPVESRPKIFGMTASPIWNPKDAAESLSTLEKNLDAKVIAVRQHVDELMTHSPKPEEIVHEYPDPPDEYPEYPSHVFWHRLNLLAVTPEIDIPVDKIRTRYEVTYASLGPYGADLYLYTDLKQRIEQMLHAGDDVDFGYLASSFVDAGGDVSFLSRSPEAYLPPQVQELQKVLMEFRPNFEDEENPGSLPAHVQLKWCSPKVRELVDLLFERYTPSFQGIVFVEQRHMAACLSQMLPAVPQLAHLIKCGQLIGHGTSNVVKTPGRGMALKTQQDIVKMFREGKINLLIATSVAEEGLDFPACDLVIRFDPLQHMVGYLQSRGRARQKSSTFVVMVQQGQMQHLTRYRTFHESEPELRRVYQLRDHRRDEREEGEVDDEDDPADLAERERYVVAATGAVLTYTGAIGLLNHLCSLIPHDRFTPVHLPRYTGDFQSVLRLPSALPLLPRHLLYLGPMKRSKKEAKRAVAFKAVKQLHALNVFDDYLLPAQRITGGDNEDPDGCPIPDVRMVPETMQVEVRDPWTRGVRQYLHVVYLDGRPCAGLVTGTRLPPVELVVDDTFVSSEEGTLVDFHIQHGWEQRRTMEDFMRIGLWWCITGRGINVPTTCYLVPITRAEPPQPDFDFMAETVQYPYGAPDWSCVSEEHYGHLWVTCNKEPGRPILLTNIRHDLSPLSTPALGSREEAYPTYKEYWEVKYARKGVQAEIPSDGPLIEGISIPRHTTCIYSLDNSPVNSADPPRSQRTVFFPIALARWAYITEEVFHAFHVLPELCHRITDVFRARAARFELGLPPIADDLMIQALTIPSANAGFSNQRLETLGDSVLKLGAVVHLYNKYPHRHEGQLDMLRRKSVSNKTLLARAREHGLEQFISGETQSMRAWRHVLPRDEDASHGPPRRRAPRPIPRRSLQDCMEATLGAAFATGGIPMALHAGTAIGISFGGPTPWNMRYKGKLEETPVSRLFDDLQEALGYTFRHGQLLLEAVTHPSFNASDHTSYQRLEFLGDALIDLVVVHYLYDKFPHATSGQLSWARSRAVCAPALASVAIKRLGLHKLILINNVELNIAISRYVPILEQISSVDIINNGWKQDPPKAISDVLESVLGAVLIDSDYDYERTAAVAEHVLRDLLEVLSPDLPRDPVSELMVWVAQSGCRSISFQKNQSRPESKRNDSISVVVHGVAVVGPVAAPNLSLAKGLAAERARALLGDPEAEHHLQKLCDCGKAGAGAEPEAKEPIDAVDKAEKAALDDETVEGFATLAHIIHEELEEPRCAAEADEHAASDDEDEGEVREEGEVEAMITIDDCTLEH